MNIALWIVAGGTVGWIAFTYFRFSVAGGLVMSVIIGALGGFFGGNVVAPMLGAVTDTPNNFNLFSMAIALTSAAACLAIGDLVFGRRGA